jgi:hypothetical protein
MAQSEEHNVFSKTASTALTDRTLAETSTPNKNSISTVLRISLLEYALLCRRYF